MTEELFREDSTLIACRARVLAVDGHGIVLERTVFYPQGGGQAGDAGELQADDGRRLAIVDTRKHPLHASAIAHLPAPDADLGWLLPDMEVSARIDGERRCAHMRLHTATHLLCALVPHPVDGCSITAAYARLDFHMTEPLDKEALNAGLARLVAGAHPVRQRWISEAELDANPGLVRSMRALGRSQARIPQPFKGEGRQISAPGRPQARIPQPFKGEGCPVSVQPPRGLGRVRVIEIEGVDRQPCGGTHVASSAEVGAVRVSKIEKKSAATRRVVLVLD